MGSAIVIMFGLFFVDNAEFLKTTEAQRAEGFTWHKMENCRAPEPVPNLPSLNKKNQEIVCYKLMK